MNNVLQALIHFFKNVGTTQSVQLDQKALVAELGQFGVSLADLESTLANMALWAASHSPTSSPLQLTAPSQTQSLPNYSVQPHQGTRIFNAEECRRISRKSRGFLLQIEQIGILSAQMRETIIDQLMQIDVEEAIRLAHTKWIAFQALFHDAPPDHVAYLEWLLFAKVMDAH